MLRKFFRKIVDIPNLPFKLDQNGTRLDRSNAILTCGRNGCTLNHYHFECDYLRKLGYSTEISPETNRQIADQRLTNKKAYYPRMKRESY